VAPIAAITGGDAQYNASVTLGILRGEAGPAREAVLLNAAAAIAAYLAEFDLSINEQIAKGYTSACEAVDSGAAHTLLDQWIELSQSLS
jgi:anthranilate phosphoribosyltransferase